MDDATAREMKRYLLKLRALENKKLQVKQQFERIDHKLDVVDPIIAEAKQLLNTENPTIPSLEYKEDAE